MVEGHCESEESVHLDCESLVLAILVDLELRVLVLILSYFFKRAILHTVPVLDCCLHWLQNDLVLSSKILIEVTGSLGEAEMLI